MVSTSALEKSRLLSTPIRDLGLTIAGTSLEPVLAEFRQELERNGIRRLRPHFFLSVEWAVPFNTIAVGIPFYLARQDLTEVHAERVGHLEGVGRLELLRYLRHEMGHVVNYGYQLYEQTEWIKHFGLMTQPYEEHYRPEPFSRCYVLHLPGWYAQKHPDEDWSETFAVWMTPRLDWRSAYADWPEALAKLDYCDRTMSLLNNRDPQVTATELDNDVSALAVSLADFYGAEAAPGGEALPPGLEGALQAVFEDFGEGVELSSGAARRPAAELISRLERDLVANVYRWTGHFPEPTRRLVQHLAERARQLNLLYPADCERVTVVALTTLIASLAMNHVCRGSYLA